MKNEIPRFKDGRINYERFASELPIPEQSDLLDTMHPEDYLEYYRQLIETMISVNHAPINIYTAKEKYKAMLKIHELYLHLYKKD